MCGPFLETMDYKCEIANLGDVVLLKTNENFMERLRKN